MSAGNDGRYGKGGKGSGINDLLLWKAFTHDVQPLEGSPDWAELEAQAAAEGRKAKPKTGSESVPVRIQHVPKFSTQMQAPQLDRRTEEKFRKGKMTIEGRLDLHGFKQDEAHAALNRFIQEAYDAGKRCVIVITGKGTPRSSEDELAAREPDSRRGILRQRVPDWLSSPPLASLVLKYASAQPKDGGSGAFYVYLKRQR